MAKRIIAIGFVYLIAVVGWITLAGTISYRTDSQDSALKHEVGRLWGTPLEQSAPGASLSVERQVATKKWDPDQKRNVVDRTTVTDKYDVPIIENDIHIGFELDQRQKGLLWYSTYRVRFSGEYVFQNAQDKSGPLTVSFAFPAADGLYDEFKFEVDGAQVPFARQNATQNRPRSELALTGSRSLHLSLWGRHKRSPQLQTGGDHRFRRLRSPG